MTRRPRRPPFVPYTTLFRSRDPVRSGGRQSAGPGASEDRVIAVDEPREMVGPRVSIAEQQTEVRSEEHTSELQSPYDLVCRLLLEKKKRLSHSKTIA